MHVTFNSICSIYTNKPVSIYHSIMVLIICLCWTALMIPLSSSKVQKPSLFLIWIFFLLNSYPVPSILPSRWSDGFCVLKFYFQWRELQVVIMFKIVKYILQFHITQEYSIHTKESVDSLTRLLWRLDLGWNIQSFDKLYLQFQIWICIRAQPMLYMEQGLFHPGM
jgi:hypothetical protein